MPLAICASTGSQKEVAKIVVESASVSIKGEKTAAEFVGAGIFAAMALEKAFAFFAGAPAFAHMGGEKPSVESAGGAAFASMVEENTRAKIARPIVCQVPRSLCFKRLLMTTRNIWCTLMRQRAHFELSIFSRLVSLRANTFMPHSWILNQTRRSRLNSQSNASPEPSL